MSRGRKIAIGFFITVVVLCGLFMLFVNWSNSDEGQATLNEVGTQQAIESLTATSAEANASGTATAIWSDIEERLKNATLVYEELYQEGTPILTSNGEDLDAYYREGIAEIIVSWNGHTILPIKKQLTDFVAEVDCGTIGAFCGIAFNILPDSALNKFYGIAIGTADSCRFANTIKSFPSNETWYCNFPSSSATGYMHHIRVEKFGQVMRFYINGELMEERLLTDEQAGSGDVGFYFGKYNENNSGIQTVQVDNFRVWELP